MRKSSIKTKKLKILSLIKLSRETINVLNKVCKVLITKNIQNKNIEALFIGLNLVDKKLLKKYPNLKYIVTHTTGLNHIDLPFCKEKKIKILSLRSVINKIKIISSTAELAIGLMLSLVRKINISSNDVLENRNWNRDKFNSLQIQSLRFGIIGFGRIGNKISKFLKLFNAKKIMVNDIKKINSVKNYDKKFIFKNSDVIFLTASDLGVGKILDKKKLKYLNNKSIFINVSRGSLIDETYLFKRLSIGKLGGLGLDVLENENKKNFLIKEKYLHKLKNKNLIITPHIGGCTIDSMNFTQKIIATHFVKVLIKKK